MKRWWKRGVAMLAALLLLGALAVGGAAWRLSRLDAADASVLAARWGAQFEPMWPALWRQPGAGPDRAQVPPAAGLRWAGTPGWRLLPRPQLRLNDVRWPVDTRLATEGELRIQQLTLALEWTSLWAGEPRLHHALAQGLSFSHANADTGLASEWQVQQVALGAADAGGSRAIDASLDLVLRPLQPSPVDDVTWLKGRWRARAAWFPARAERPAHWRQVQLQFQGELAGQRVEDAQLRIARWQHQPAQQVLAWDELQLQARLGERGTLGRLDLRWPALLMGPDGASGTPATGEWSALQPFPLKLSLDSGLPRGRYGAVHWPLWRVALAGQQGTRAGGQVQADLAWLGVAEGLRWDALVGQFSVQPAGQPERQWSLRGQAQWNARVAAWHLEGQAHGGAPEQAVWDGPFATQGEWRRWPQPRVAAQLQLTTLQLDRWQASRPADKQAAWWLGWHRWPGSLDLRVGYLTGLGLRLGSVVARLDNDGTRVRMPQFKARLWDGTLTASGQWAQADGRWTLAAQLQEAELAALRETLAAPAPRSGKSEPLAQGRWSGQLALQGQAWDTGALRGDWSWDARAGHWSGIDLGAAWLAPSGAWRVAEAGERTEWRRLRAAGTIAAGLAQGEMQLQAPTWRAQANGELDLRQAALELNWQAQPARRNRPATLRMSGPWQAPRTLVP